MALSKQSNDVISSILNNRVIPLSKRLALRSISSRWSTLLENDLALVTRLTINHHCGWYSGWYCGWYQLNLKGSHLTDEVIQLLGRLFPRLTHLGVTFGHSDSSSWSKLPALLDQFREQLTWVSLFGWGSNMEAVGRALNGLPRLTSLAPSLVCESTSLLLFQLQPATLSRLTKFVYSREFDYANLNLLHFVSSSFSSRLTHLKLVYSTPYVGPAIFLTRLASHLTHVNVTVWYVDRFWESLSMVRGLQSLTLIKKEDVLVMDPFRQLSSFPRLVNLKLGDLSYKQQIEFPPAETVPPLGTIKRLTLNLYFTVRVRDFENFYRDLIVFFPNLVHLTLYCSGRRVSARHLVTRQQLPFSLEILPGSFYIY